MKKSTLLFAICIIYVSCNTKTVKEENLKEVKDTIQKEFSFATRTDSIVENGEQIYYHKNGGIEMRGIMKDNKRDGLWKSFYENGTPWSETTFKEGKKNGKTTTWYENGKKRYDGFFTNDRESGRWVFWREDGTIEDTRNYELK
jgi:antitoxin component YwqK of YwqJK toxin-antitoxin module